MEPSGTPKKLDCGHPPTPQPEGSIAVGQVTGTDGKTACYQCAEERERQSFAEADDYYGYLTDRRPDVITTWTGAVLAKVTACVVGPTRYTPTGGAFRVVYIRAEAPDGSSWYGTGSTDGELVSLHRSKRKH